MTRYEKFKIDFLIATRNDEPEKRFRALKKMGDTFPYEAYDEYLTLQERFESDNDLTREEAVEMLKNMHRH